VRDPVWGPVNIGSALLGNPLSPRWGFSVRRHLPVACAMGCIVTPRRGCKRRRKDAPSDQRTRLAWIRLSKINDYLVDNVC
jgi:hypothetical protein